MHFLNELDGTLLNAHYVRLQSVILKLFECDRDNLKVHGIFVDTCVWTNDAATEVVDTCACHRISGYKVEAVNIMYIYYSIEKRMKRNKLLKNMFATQKKIFYYARKQTSDVLIGVKVTGKVNKKYFLD